MHIIKRKDITTYFYAGSDIHPENVWTTKADLATRFKDRTIAVSMQGKVAERTRANGTYSIAELQIQQYAGI